MRNEPVSSQNCTAVICHFFQLTNFFLDTIFLSGFCVDLSFLWSHFLKSSEVRDFTCAQLRGNSDCTNSWCSTKSHWWHFIWRVFIIQNSLFQCLCINEAGWHEYMLKYFLTDHYSSQKTQTLLAFVLKMPLQTFKAQHSLKVLPECVNESQRMCANIYFSCIYKALTLILCIRIWK